MAERASDKSDSLIPEGVDVSAYLLHTPMEIGYVLRALALKKDLVSVFYDRAGQSILSTIVDVDVKSNRFWFDVSSINAANTAVLASNRLVFVASPEGVKIQFVVNDTPRWGDFDGRAAFVSSLPDDMIKLQRREYFRLETPVGRALVCKAPYGGRMVELPVHDVSIGGMGLWLPPNSKIDIGDVLQGSRVDLGTFGVVEVNLEVRSNRMVTRRSGSTQPMLGCCFQSLPRSTENILQRYIAQLERERHQMLKK